MPRGSRKKPLKFVFHTGFDREEEPAKAAAERVAEILRRRGHQVRIVQMPEDLHYQHLIKKRRLTRDALERVLNGRRKRLEELHRLGRADEHVIDWHNSHPEVFFPAEKRQLHEYPMTAHSESHTCAITPISLVPHKSSGRERIVATLELPGIRKKRRLNRDEGRIMDLLEELREHGENPELFDLALDCALKIGSAYPIEESRKAGFMSNRFMKRIADELEAAASNPTAIRMVPKNLEKEVEIAGLIRTRPHFVREGAREEIEARVRAAREELEKFKRDYDREAEGMRRLPFEQQQPRLKILNARREELENKVWAAQEELDTYNGMMKWCRKMGVTPGELMKKYGMMPHFHRKRD